MNKFSNRKRITWDEKGALEGLPLYLIILVVITAIAIVIIITWLSTMQEAGFKTYELTTSPSEDGIHTSDTNPTITVKCWDDRDSPLEGVSITLEGAGITPQMGKTDSDGLWTSATLDPDFSGTFSSITVTMTYSGQRTTKLTGTVNVMKD